MTTFKALRVHQIEKKTEACFEQISVTDLTPGEVVVKVQYSSLNYKDALAVSGKGRIMRRFPCVAGIDLSGVVTESAAAQFKPGDAVLVTGCNIGEQFDGGLAEYARIAADSVVPLPKGLNAFEAMALGTAGFTAALALRRMLENHQKPEMGPIAVTGPTGGVGSVAIQLFKRAGFTVHAITGKAAEGEAYLKSLGADAVIDRKILNMGSKPMEAGVWGGAVDNLGGDTLAYLTRTIKPWGNIASIGLAQSHELHTTVMPFILRGASLLGIHSVECPRAWRLDIWDKLAGPWKPAALDRIAARTIPLDEVPKACEALIAGTQQGRYVVKIG